MWVTLTWDNGDEKLIGIDALVKDHFRGCFWAFSIQHTHKEFFDLRVFCFEEEFMHIAYQIWVGKVEVYGPVCT